MEHALQFAHYLISFFVVLSSIVFIHEFGHYIVARLCGVKIEAFSIGFGKELIGWNDRTGTRWKIAALPLGGYVKMYGDASAVSNADEDAIEQMTPEEKAKTFHYKKLPQKAAIVSAGPAANFLLSITVFTVFIFTGGLPSTEPVIGEVMKNSAAQEAGLLPGDRITSVAGEEVKRFTDIPYLIATNLGTPVHITFLRDGTPREVVLTPQQKADEDGLGNKVKRPLIGIKSTDMRIEDVGLPRAVWEATKRTYFICESTIRVIGQIVTGKRSVDELKGPVGIAQLSGQATDKGITTTFWLIALLSANLGLVNLFPIPMLDGGHLAYYVAEALRGRPLAQKVQEWGFRIGLAAVGTLMAFTIFNDIRQLIFS